MDDFLEIPSYELSELLSALKPYQRNSMLLLVKEYGEEEAAKKWLSANGPSDTQKFGGTRANPEPFWDRFNEEFQALVCGDKKYKQARKDIMSKGSVVALALVTEISNILASALGLPLPLILPVVSVTLTTVGKVGIGAYCKSRT